MNDNLELNKNANNKVDAWYKIWLEMRDVKITLTEDEETEMEELRGLLNQDPDVHQGSNSKQMGKTSTSRS